MAKHRLAVSFAGALAVCAGVGTLCHAAFEEVGAGARAVGMGSAFTAVADDAHAVHYNPAGLAQVRRGEIVAGYGKLFAGLKDKSNLGAGFVGAAQPIKQGAWGTLGLGWTSFSLDSAYREDSIGIAYGRETFQGLFAGSTVKVLKRSFGSDLYTEADPLFARHGQNTTNFSFDFGLLFRPQAAYSFAFSIKDANQPDVSLGGGEKLPLEFRGGFGYHQRQLVFDAELSRKDSDTTVAMGIEKWLFRSMALRSGFAIGARNKRDIAIGMGYKTSSLGLDYAFNFPLSGIESTAGSHRLSLSIRFGKEPERAHWEFEESDQAVERLLEQKSAQIAAMEQEISELRELQNSGKLESGWTRQQIKRIEDRLRNQESQEVEALKSRLLESRLESQKMKKQLDALQKRIDRLAAPRTEPNAGKPEPAQPASEPVKPAVRPYSVPKTYTVQDGDTLQSIAQRFFKNPQQWVDIYELNSDRLERGATLRPGQVLLMPHQDGE